MIADGPLDALAARLVVPNKCGVYISKSDMVVLARLADGSLRVNERRRMLADVLKSPDNLKDLAQTVDRLIEFCQMHVERYEALARSFPSLGPALASWTENTKRTVVQLSEIRDELLEG